jgi:hypothetical protein
VIRRASAKQVKERGSMSEREPLPSLNEWKEIWHSARDSLFDVDPKLPRRARVAIRIAAGIGAVRVLLPALPFFVIIGSAITATYAVDWLARQVGIIDPPDPKAAVDPEGRTPRERRMMRLAR